jgi:WD40 repeat protein
MIIKQFIGLKIKLEHRFCLKFILCVFTTSICSSIVAQEPLLVLPVGHTDGIVSAVFSPDGKLVLTASEDYTARIYDAFSGKELRTFNKLPDALISAVFSPDNKLALTLCQDNTARIYDVVTGEESKLLGDYANNINYAVFLSEGKKILTVNKEGNVRIHNIEIGRKRASKEIELKNFFNSEVLSSDGKLILVKGDDNTIRIWDIKTGIESLVLKGHTGEINSAVLSPDGKFVISSSMDSTARIWDSKTGFKIITLKEDDGQVNSAVLSQDGKFVISSSTIHGTARIWDSKTGSEICTLKRHQGQVYSAVFSLDGKFALTASEDHTARIYDVLSGKELRVLEGHTDGIVSAVNSSDGKLALTISGDQTYSIFEVTSGNELHVSMDTVKSAVISLNSKLALTVLENGKLKILDIYKGIDEELLSENSYFGAFSEDGTLALIASDDSIQIINISTKKVVNVLESGITKINTAIFSPNGKFILLDCDSTLCIYDLSTGKEIQRLGKNSNSQKPVSFSPNSEFVLTLEDLYDSTEVTVYNRDSGNKLFSKSDAYYKTPKFGPESNTVLMLKDDQEACIYEFSKSNEPKCFGDQNYMIISAEFNSSENKILTVCDDNTIRIFDVESRNIINTLKGHSDEIKSAYFGSDGKTVLSTSDDHKTILWDVASGKPIYTRLQLKNNDWLVYDQDYRFDGSPGAIDYLYLVCGLEVIDLEQVKDSLYVPGLVSKILNKVPLMRDGNRIPKLSDLDMCNRTPLVEKEDDIKKGEFRYRITPRKGDLGATEVYINSNLTFTYEKEQLKEVKVKNQTTYYELVLTQEKINPFLVSRDSLSFNPIVVKSKIANGSIYSRGVKVEMASTIKGEKARFYGVFIGVDEYGNPNKISGDGRYRNLDFAAKDANDLANAIEATTGKLFDERNIFRLTGKEYQPPTKEEIHATLDSIGKNALANDVLFIFFAGHGDIKKSEQGKNEMIFITERSTIGDTTSCFSIADLMEWCNPQNIKAQKRVFVFDACHSGQAVDDFRNSSFVGRGEDQDTRILQLTKLNDKNGMMILAASAANESAYEDPTLKQGVLTYHLLDAMKNDINKLSSNQDSLLVIRNWFDLVIDQVTQYGQQNAKPQTPTSFGDGRFYIGKITSEVQNSIDVSPQKIRLGKSLFLAVDIAKKWCPNLSQIIDEKLVSCSGEGEYVYKMNDGSFGQDYYALGYYQVQNKNIIISYELFYRDKIVGDPIVINKFKITDNPAAVAEAVKLSLEEQLDIVNLNKK